MAKHRYDVSADRYAKWWAEGRGSGRGTDYQPWLRIQDLSSRGRSSRLPGQKTGRVHEVMSDLERAVLLEFDNMDEVVDIREQFPLQQSSTLRLAAQAGIRHPQVHGADIVMTTDFVVDVKIRKRSFAVAVAVKYAADLNDRRTIEKLEIERRYWLAEKTPWVLITELDLSADRTAVALWRHGWHTFDHLNETPEYWAARCETMLVTIAGAGDASLLDIIRSLERHGDFATGDGLTVVRHLLATGALELIGDGAFDPRGPAGQLIPTRIASNAGRDAA